MVSWGCGWTYRTARSREQQQGADHRVMPLSLSAEAARLECPSLSPSSPRSPGSNSVLGADSAERNFLHQSTQRTGAAVAEGEELRAQQQPRLELPTKCL